MSEGHNHRRPHVHPQRKLIIDRVARAEGHLRGIKQMLEQDRDCTDVLVQLSAVRSAIDQISRLVLEDHVDSCLAAAQSTGDLATELDRIKEALRTFKP